MKRMEIIQVTPRGYCKGVTRAIALAKKTALEHPDTPIHVLGMLVHNTYVMEALQQLQIHFVDNKTKTRMQLLDEIEEGVVIFTAHGIAPAVKQKALEKGLICVDASCPDVVKTQDIVLNALSEGYEVLYIGKHQHPEAEAVLQLSEHIHLVDDAQSIASLDGYDKVFVTNQTTMSIFDIEKLFELIRKKFPHATFCEEICNATRIRQQAVADLLGKNIDVLYVVGDAHSNNSTRLASIAKDAKIPSVYLVDSVQDLEEEQFQDASIVAVTSGASTPTYLTNQVIQYLQTYEKGQPKPIVELEKII